MSLNPKKINVLKHIGERTVTKQEVNPEYRNALGWLARDGWLKQDRRDGTFVYKQTKKTRWLFEDLDIRWLATSLDRGFISCLSLIISKQHNLVYPKTKISLMDRKLVRYDKAGELVVTNKARKVLRALAEMPKGEDQ